MNKDWIYVKADHNVLKHCDMSKVVRCGPIKVFCIRRWVPRTEFRYKVPIEFFNSGEQEEHRQRLDRIRELEDYKKLPRIK
jgi:hypothetical protein